MHVVLLALVAFYAAQPATKDHPAVPETVRSTGALTPSLDACKAMGEATASQVAQMKGVVNVQYACIEIANPADRPV